MKVFNHTIVEAQIIGISPVKTERGVNNDRRYFEVYTKTEPVRIESEWYDAMTPHGKSVIARFQAEYEAALSAVRKVTTDETQVYSKHATEVDAVYCNVRETITQLCDFLHPDGARDQLDLDVLKSHVLESVHQLRTLALQ